MKLALLRKASLFCTGRRSCELPDAVYRKKDRRSSETTIEACMHLVYRLTNLHFAATVCHDTARLARFRPEMARDTEAK